MACVNLTKEFPNLGAEMRRLYELISKETSVVFVEGEKPMFVTPYEEARDFITARVANHLASESDEVAKRLMLRKEGKGTSRVWDELNDE